MMKGLEDLTLDELAGEIGALFGLKSLKMGDTGIEGVRVTQFGMIEVRLMDGTQILYGERMAREAIQLGMIQLGIVN